MPHRAKATGEGEIDFKVIVRGNVKENREAVHVSESRIGGRVKVGDKNIERKEPAEGGSND